MIRSRRLLAWFPAILLGLLSISLGMVPSAWGQSAGLAEISGTVRDQTGAVVPGAQVIISNPSKGVRVELTTSGGGVFDAPALLPASGYEVTVDKQGFAHYQAKDIDLPVGKNIGLDISLELGAATAQVEVTGTPEVDDTKTDVSQVIDPQQILDLPINGRRVDSFVLLTPGVTNDGNLWLAHFPRRREWQYLPARRQRLDRAVLRSRTTAAPALCRRSRRTPCRSSRWFPRISRPNTATPWAAWSIPSPAVEPTIFMARPIGSSATRT